MFVSLTDAPAQLPELIRRAQSGEEVVITSNGSPSVRLTPVSTVPLQDLEKRLAEIGASGARMASPGPSAARSQDFLYDEDGLPA